MTVDYTSGASMLVRVATRDPLRLGNCLCKYGETREFGARLRGPLRSQGHGHHTHAAPIPRMLSHKDDGSTWVFVGGARMCKRTADSILYNFPGFFETNDESATLNN